MTLWEQFLAAMARKAPALRPDVAIGHWPQNVHVRGITEDGAKIVYCPKGRIVSWNPGDYEHQWCHFCQIFFSEKVKALLTDEERERMGI
jgi:hypothetical protein